MTKIRNVTKGAIHIGPPVIATVKAGETIDVEDRIATELSGRPEWSKTKSVPAKKAPAKTSEEDSP